MLSVEDPLTRGNQNLWRRARARLHLLQREDAGGAATSLAALTTSEVRVISGRGGATAPEAVIKR